MLGEYSYQREEGNGALSYFTEEGRKIRRRRYIKSEFMYGGQREGRGLAS